MITKGFFSQKVLIALSLLALYFIWGSTYLAMRFAIEGFPPFMMAALRFSVAGGVLYAGLRLCGYANPSVKQWLGGLVVGFLLLVVGNGSVAYAEQTVSSSVAALVLATVPIWVALFSGLWGHWPRQREWLGIIIGTLGVALLSMNGTIQASPLGAALIVLCAISWSFGSVWGKYLPMPQGAMASAVQMLTAGILLILVSVVSGEHLMYGQYGAYGEHGVGMPSAKSVYALLYLIVFGSLIAYSAYLYLLKTVRPALATSNTFVNPVVAIFLGAGLGHEAVGLVEYASLAVIMLGVVLVLSLKNS